MNTGPASERTLRDELAIGIASGLASYVGVQFSVSQAWDVVERMLAEKARREAVVRESSTTDHSGDANKMAELQAANRELVEALEKFMEAGFGFSTSPAMRSEAYNKACEVLAKHKGVA